MSRPNIKELTKIAYIIFINSKNKKALIGSGISLSLVMIPLIIVYYMSSNIMNSTIEKYIENEGFSIQIEYNEPQKYEQLRSKLEKFKKEYQNDELRYFFERRTYGIIGNKKKQGVLIRAVENKFIDNNKHIKLIYGNKNLQKDEILISKQIKDRLHLNINESIYIVVPNNKHQKVFPKVKRFNISGIIETGLREVDKNLVLISLQDSNIMSKNFSKSIIGISTKSNTKEKTNNLKKNIEKEFKEYKIKTFYELYLSKYTNLDISKKLLIFIMAFIVIFASINISSSLCMLILENKKKIAIFKSIGMNNSSLKLIFILIALVLSSTFCMIGIIIGNYITINIEYLINIIDIIINTILKTFGADNTEILNSDYYISEFNIKISLKFSLIILLSYTLISITTALIPLNIISKLKEKEILK
ncbi:ABC transporter permease [Borrelia miyamotoi]|uniref:ABC transporter permease n=1 Tax=Borrelia miyamotoi TaxID=47466 RepID=A0AAX3JN52_9SPIR|nr:FtsX-like permease family protein [Borrelia miyamotoi]QFP42215.1 ABC transporter permease [Borrelia miyamotoi]QFP48329.1 FtsX-like permease family protein [Borrelia miyamotoi]QGT56090.1 FtsX-like permease family protein [Borrelia miyamotoi]QGT56870.1 FtsX-like permease family protein [Borrelia miyamotoi]WAZ72134.1 ABC transporter permease [Borrelia miyamotoi]